jgi:diguanylate cyclase (GGDEF)-like protein
MAVNDSEGHPAGDKVLQIVASRLRGQMRSYDLIIRLGGDEFLCVLPGVSANKVRERFARLKRPDDGHGAVSVGLTELRDGDGVQELISRADDDLIATRGR